ncbi:TPA: hybrid sensor histidine kinase/response regulator [Burkholderia cepacia]
MKPSIRTAPVIVVILIAMLSLAATVGGYYIHNLLLSPKAIQAMLGPQENYYWAVGQFQVALSETSELLATERLEKKFDADLVIERYEVLLSKFDRISARSAATAPLYAQQGYADAIARIGAALTRTSMIADHLGDDGEGAKEIEQGLQEIKPDAYLLARNAGDAEIAQRENLYSDFMAKRNTIFIAIVVVAGLMAVLVVLIFITYRDQKRQIAAREQLIHAEHQATLAANEAVRMKNAFLGTIGHELRTPLQGITAAIDTLAGSPLAEQHRGTVRRLENAAQQIEAQMKDLTDYARIDSGKLELRKSTFDATELIKATAADVRQLAAQKGLELVVQISGDYGLSFSDPVRIRQIVTNLLTNAIKYTDEGTVTLRFNKRRASMIDQLTIEVQDTGIGIPPDKLRTIFQPFTQVDDTHTRRHEGVGMGLAIVHGLVDLLGGQIDARSEVGKGSTFTVRLPVSVMMASEHELEVQRMTDLSNEDRCILVVDDHENARQAFVDLLRRLGFSYDACESAERAMQKLMRRPYDALLLDVQMPGRDGVSVARELRSRHGPNREIPIIGISAYPRELLTDEQRKWFGDYLMKPVRLEVLHQALNQALAKPRANP